MVKPTGLSARELTKNTILDALLEEPLRYEKITTLGCRGTINKYLRELVEEDKLVELTTPTVYGEKTPYRIVPEKRKQAEETVGKQKLFSILEFADAQETEEITNFLFNSLQYVYHYALESKHQQSVDYVVNMIKLLDKLKDKQKLERLITIKASTQIIEIGAKISRGQEITSIERIMFKGYPIDKKDAEGDAHRYLTMIDTNGQKPKSYFSILKEANPTFAKSIEDRYDKLLGRKDALVMLYQC